MSYVLNAASEWKTFYMTLWEEKNKSHWCTLLRDLETEPADLPFHWPDVDFKLFLEPVKRAPDWFRRQRVIPEQDLCGAWRGSLSPADTQKMSIHHKTGSEALYGQLISTETQLLQWNSQYDMKDVRWPFILTVGHLNSSQNKQPVLGCFNTPHLPHSGQNQSCKSPSWTTWR